MIIGLHEKSMVYGYPSHAMFFFETKHSMLHDHGDHAMSNILRLFLQGQDYHTVIQLPFLEGLLCLLLIFLVSSDNVFFQSEIS